MILCKKDKKFFSLNKPRDFKKCSLVDLTITDDGCILEDVSSQSKGLLILKPFDCYEKGMVWDRLTITAQMPKGCKLTGYFVATEDKDLYDQIRNPIVERMKNSNS